MLDSQLDWQHESVVASTPLSPYSSQISEFCESWDPYAENYKLHSRQWHKLSLPSEETETNRIARYNCWQETRETGRVQYLPELRACVTQHNNAKFELAVHYYSTSMILHGRLVQGSYAWLGTTFPRQYYIMSGNSMTFSSKTYEQMFSDKPFVFMLVNRKCLPFVAQKIGLKNTLVWSTVERKQGRKIGTLEGGGEEK